MTSWETPGFFPDCGCLELIELPRILDFLVNNAYLITILYFILHILLPSSLGLVLPGLRCPVSHDDLSFLT